jgi:hypothetical protein
MKKKNEEKMNKYPIIGECLILDYSTLTTTVWVNFHIDERHNF